MAHSTVSVCGKFVVIDGLHIDRNVFRALASWAEARGLTIQDAMQVAACALGERPEQVKVPPLPTSSPRLRVQLMRNPERTD